MEDSESYWPLGAPRNTSKHCRIGNVLLISGLAIVVKRANTLTKVKHHDGKHHTRVEEQEGHSNWRERRLMVIEN